MPLIREESHPFFPFGFALTQQVVDALNVKTILPETGNRAVRRNVFTIRVLAQRINDHSPGLLPEGRYASSGELIALSLISEVLRYFFDHYCFEENPGALGDGLDQFSSTHGEESIEGTLHTFVGFFPPLDVLTSEADSASFLQAASPDGHSNQLLSIRELLLLSLSVENPAAQHLVPLFDDRRLKDETVYEVLVQSLETFFESQPASEFLGGSLFHILRAPMKAAPDSLIGQLEFIYEHWGKILPSYLQTRLLVGRDLLREEHRPRGFGPAPAEVLTFRSRKPGQLSAHPEYERFTRDRDWMSNVVLIAKSIYVWLDQLSKSYEHEITRLDQIPDEELDRLAEWGFTGLWLIGVWERSHASQRIKQLRGNPEAVASAYSIYDYVIAAELGGESAYENLRSRAWARGIRLASDMVPNHMGIDSRWVVEHPDWFIQSDHSPFPNYSFTGENLSGDPRVSIRIEDRYWDHRDAAVVFQRVDNASGEARYVYHGNDGTHMPWNDTAQLNYLLPEVREAAIQTILHVARKFPIIRFDAAMTLAKRHFHRLWFPPPGLGGDIPSRSEHGLDAEEFNSIMPEEFWRQVVDRIAQELPDTLLLAEAFWLMEGYFVRTLGMHRVYNSAFMNMLKDEENSKYRLTIRNVLEFSPEILRRFVNFMNNPDEKTAVEQFGKGDKYLGICLMMATMPGLPMFGHGQIEGFAEKYGMEYRKAYWDESVDQDLVNRHIGQIFPFLRKRYLYSGVENFAFYDFFTPEGHVNEDVFAYSNRAGNERAIILYNNSLRSTSGWIRISTPINMGSQDETDLQSRSLVQALNLRTESNVYYLLRDHRDSLQYIRSGRQLADEGLFVQLPGYQYQAFIDLEEILDSDGTWGQLAARLSGSGAPDLKIARKEMILSPILNPMTAFLQSVVKNGVKEIAIAGNKVTSDLFSAARRYDLATLDWTRISRQIEKDCITIDDLLSEWAENRRTGPATAKQDPEASEELLPDAPLRSALRARSVLVQFEKLFIRPQTVQPNGGWVSDWLIEQVLVRAFEADGNDDPSPDLLANLSVLLYARSGFLGTCTVATLAEDLAALLSDADVAEYLQLNEYEGSRWISKERLEWLIQGLWLAEKMPSIQKEDIRSEDNQPSQNGIDQIADDILVAAQDAGYRLERIIQLLS